MVWIASRLLWLVLLLFTLASNVAETSSSSEEDRGLFFPVIDQRQGTSSPHRQRQAALLSSPVVDSSSSSSTQGQPRSRSRNVIPPPKNRRRGKRVSGVDEATSRKSRWDAIQQQNDDNDDEEEGIGGANRERRPLDKSTKTWARNVKQRLRNKLDVIRSEPYGSDRLSLSITKTRAGKPLTLRWTWNDARNLILLEAEGIPGTGKVKQLVALTKMANPRFTGQPNAEEVFRVMTGDQEGEEEGSDDDDHAQGAEEEEDAQKQMQLAEEIFRERLPIAIQYGRPNPFGLDATLVARLSKVGLHHLDELHRQLHVKDILKKVDGAAPDDREKARSSSPAALDSGEGESEGEAENLGWQQERSAGPGAVHAVTGLELAHLRRRVTQKLRLQATPASEMGRPRLWTTEDAADLRRLILSGSTKVFKYLEEAQRANPDFRVEGVDANQERFERKRAKVEAMFRRMNASQRLASIPPSERGGEASGAGERVEGRGGQGRGKRVAVPDNSESLLRTEPSPPRREEESASPPRRLPYNSRQMHISRAFITSRNPSGSPVVEHVYRNPQAEQSPVRPTLPPFRQVHPPSPPQAAQQQYAQSSSFRPSRHRAQLAPLLAESMPPQSSIALSFAQPHTPLFRPVRPFTSYSISPIATSSSQQGPAPSTSSQASSRPQASQHQRRRRRRHRQEEQRSSVLESTTVTTPLSPRPLASSPPGPGPSNDDSVPSSPWTDTSTPEWLQYLLALRSP